MPGDDECVAALGKGPYPPRTDNSNENGRVSGDQPQQLHRARGLRANRVRCPLDKVADMRTHTLALVSHFRLCGLEWRWNVARAHRIPRYVIARRNGQRTQNQT